jgi:AraC family transcriptional regulator, regulatory protein of adaptative response / methylphosphotriester-DNA alkyltransferase methyltransferase
VRMERAAELLARRGLTVREVAHRVGYRQPAQFAKAFRRHKGLAPSAFRSRAGGGHRAAAADAYGTLAHAA